MIMKPLTVCFAVLLLTYDLGAGHSGSADTAQDQERLANVTRYLKDAMRDVFGEKEASRFKFPTESMPLWEHARKVHAALYGEAETKKQFDRAERTVTALEEVVFSLMRILYGREWYTKYHRTSTQP
jgi:hypothetical protein